MVILERKLCCMAWGCFNYIYQAIKYSLLYTFVNWVRVYIKDRTLSMIDFID